MTKKDDGFLQKRNEIVNALLDMPVGGVMTFQGETTSTPNGVYKLLHSRLTHKKIPAKYVGSTFDGELMIKKVSDDRAGY